MRVYFLRHGDAGSPSSDPKKERERPLSALGVKQATAVAQAIKDNGREIRTIYASTFTRAWQTADIVGRLLGVGVQILDRLGPVMPLDRFIRNLLDNKDSSGKTTRVLLCAHHDNFEPLLAMLTGKDVDPFVTAEFRQYRINSDMTSAKEKRAQRICPSDVGVADSDGGTQ